MTLHYSDSRVAITDRTHGPTPIFMGKDYWPGNDTALDSDESVIGLLGFLSLKPGDTDAEYFENYTRRQMSWCDERAEELSLIILEAKENKLPDASPSWEN